MENIKNVIYDLGGVLVDLDLDLCLEAFESLGMPKVAALINPYYPAEMIGRMEKGDISFHEACEEMRRLDNRPDITDEQIADAYGAFLTDIPVYKLRQIDKLREAGIRTYVLSNNNTASMQVVRHLFTADGHTMDHYFDKVYLSYELQELKPTEAIFRKTIADSGCVPEETLFIDDGKKNVDAAAAMGFAVYMPAPGEDFGHLLNEIIKYANHEKMG
ncbi:HAD-IA family hydrolase [uncultured Alistipes sp.]|jgi:HAD hydrolase, family IA, variant 3|uniref:HAD-IA family hydrolase n=1 Tax=uncultured Alistipes sp. TaxID=538949 RepID=UPI0025D77EE9|nr:HAD-IA family hydrolase [uncultured Alistipes sp.]